MPTFTQVTVNADRCKFIATCNGFPIFEHKGDSPWSGTNAVDPYLVGNGNKLRFTFTHKEPDATFSASVKEVRPGDVVDTSEQGDLTLPDGNVLEHTFDSEKDPFKAVLDKANPTDAKTVIDFALKLRDAVRATDDKALLAMNRLRINDIAALYEAPPEALEPQILGMLQSFADGGADFEAGDLDATGWCDNKVWQVRRKNGDALLHVKEPDGSMSSEAYIAMLPDGPQVVR
jgi:hypothetical protein